MAAMTRLTQGLSLLVLASAVHAADTAQDLRAMHNVEQAWLMAYNAGDAVAVSSLYWDDALLMPPHQPAVSGKAAIQRYVLKLVAAARSNGDVLSVGANPDGATNGDMGWEGGSYAFRDKSGRVIDTGKYLSVFRKKEGQWRFVRDIWNSDSATPAAAR